MVGVPSRGSDSLISMDNSSEPDSGSVEHTLQEIWQLSARQTVALEAIAGSLRFILGAVETAVIWYLVFYIGTVLVGKFLSKVEP
jgi:hypothetical protein